MGEKTQQTVALADKPAVNSPAPAVVNNDVFGDRKVNIMDLPVIGHQNKGAFIPAEPAEKGKPADEPEAPKTIDGDGKSEGDDNAGQPGKEGAPAESVAVLKAKNGREFKTPSELLTTYDASSTEARRLAAEAKTSVLAMDDLSGKLNDANKTILAMQEYIGNAAYMPNVPEKYKGMAEKEMLETMTDDEKLDYRLDKREWGKKVETFKTQMAKAREESEAIATRVKSEIERNEAMMSQDKETYPDFTGIKPLRDEILKQSPHLANRPDSPYVAFYMATGIIALKEKAESAKLEAQSRASAAAKAEAAAAQGGGGTQPSISPNPKPKDDGLRGLVKAGKALKTSF